jgi:hypothetical protein
MNVRQEWSTSNLSPIDLLYYTAQETIDNVKANFDIRRYYSAEGCSVTVGGITEQVIIQNHTNPLNESDVDKKLLLPITSTAQTGDYVVYKGDTWIINSKINIVDDAYKLCQMQYCNFTLKFQSPSGTILSYPCIDSTNSALGLDETDIITTGNGVHTIKVPFDSNTILLREDRRFFLDKDTVNPRSYRITKVNTTEFNYGSKGLIELTVKQCQAGEPDDNITLGICNYVTPTTPPVIPEDETYTTITSSGELIIGGATRTLTAVAHNDNGTVNSTVILIWTITKPTGYESYVVDTYPTNRTCTIKILEEDTYGIVDKTVAVEVSDGSGGYVGSIELLIIV